MTGRQGRRWWRATGAICAATIILAAVPVLNGQDRSGEPAPEIGDEFASSTQPDGALRLASQPAVPRPSAAEPPPPESPPAAPRVRPATAPTLAAMPTYRRSRFQLASVPNMYGDTLPPGGQMAASKGLAIVTLADLPLAGGARRIKVAENNKALPMDRLILNYNHFENARDMFYDSFGPPVEANLSTPIDRFVIGLEKSFHDELWSLDVRMPFVNRFRFSEPNPAYAIAGDEIGNLHATVKVLLYENDWWAAAGGLGVDVPTGSDVRGAVEVDPIHVNNDAVHLAPFVGFVGAPDDTWFYHAFLEVDVPLNGNQVLVNGIQGTLNEQTVLNLDLAGGCWLYRNLEAPLLTGVAAVAEVHYTTTLNDTDLLTMKPTGIDYAFSNFPNRMDIVNATVGVHTEIARHTTLRVGGEFPLATGTDRLFNAELLVQLNGYF